MDINKTRTYVFIKYVTGEMDPLGKTDSPRRFRFALNIYT